MRARVTLLISLVTLIAIVLSLRACVAGDEPTRTPASASRATERVVRAPRRLRASSGADVAPSVPDAADANEMIPSPSAKPARLSVTVRHADGSPAAGVRVVVARSGRTGGGFGDPWERVPHPCPPQTTDTDGRTTFEAEHFWHAWAAAADGDKASIAPRSVALRAGGEAAVALTLAPSFRVRGEVMDLDGLRVRTARVRMLVRDVLSSMVSSVGPYAWAVDPIVCTNGAFEFAGVLPLTRREDEAGAWLTPREFVIESHANGFLDSRTAVDSEAYSRGAAVTVTLVRTGVVRGRCTDAEGRGVASVVINRVRVFEESFQQRDWSATTNADGRFEFADFPEVGGTLEFARGEFASRKVAVASFDPRVGHDLGDVVLKAGLTARGRVVAPDGAPVAGAGIWFADAEGVTDSEGHFVIERLRPGPWHVYVQDDIGMRKGSLDVTDISDEVTVFASNDRHVRLRILFAEGSEPTDDPPYVRVGWRRQGEPADARAHERWLRKRYAVWIQPKQAGRWIVRVEMAGWEPAEVPVDVLAGRAIETRVTLTKSEP